MKLLQSLQGFVESLQPRESLADTVKSSDPKLHYLIDLEYGIDVDTGFGRIPHLSIFNPGKNDADLRITTFYTDRSPSTFQRTIPAQASSESDARSWPVPLNSRFALQIESPIPIIAQVTQGWNNTGNDYSTRSLSKRADRARETAKSYMSIASLGREFYVADGIVIDAPNDTWIRETEEVVILNPGRTPLIVTFHVYHGKRKITRWGLPLRIPVLKRQVHIPAERLGLVPMAGWVYPNWHYGARISGDKPFAAQWLRKVHWYDSAELMSEWSVPCMPIE